MKSKIRSRWYRANEKPLESNSSGASAEAPFGEINPTKGKALEETSPDELSDLIHKNTPEE